MMGYYYGDFGTFGFLGMITHLLWWALIIAGIVLLVRFIMRESDRGGERHGGRALDILKERYAKGEINKEEFEQKKKDLL